MLVEADELYTACLTLGDGIGLLQAQQQTIYYQLPERLLAELEHTNDAAKGGGGGGGGGLIIAFLCILIFKLGYGRK